MKLRLILSLGVIGIFGLTLAHAQSIPGVGGIDLIPSILYPTPGQTITITAQSYSTDLNAANISWSAGGKSLGKGIGLTTITIQAPTAGKNLTVTANATGGDGTTYTAEVIISSASMDIVIEPQGYVHAMFMGKPPVVYQNRMKVIAFPHIANSAGIEYDPATLVYKWQQGDAVLQDQSGYGKQSVILTGGIIPRPFQVTVTASTRDGEKQSMTTVTVAPKPARLVFYRNDPLYGPLYNHAIGDVVYIGSQRETGILAVPYGFNMPASGGLGDVSLKWFTNGRERTELATNQSITLRAPSGASGSADVELDITNSKDFLQQATAAFRAVFDGSGSTTPLTY